jgi:hypothetical protein
MTNKNKPNRKVESKIADTIVKSEYENSRASFAFETTGCFNSFPLEEIFLENLFFLF